MLTWIPINNRTLKVGWNEVLVDVNSCGAHNNCVGSPCKESIMQTIYTHRVGVDCSIIVREDHGDLGPSMETDDEIRPVNTFWKIKNRCKM